MASYLYRPGAGIVGATSRNEHLVVEPQYIDATAALTAPLQFGKPMKTSAAGLMQALVAGDSVALITGWLKREYPTGASQDPLGVSTAGTAGLANRVVRGYMSVLLNEGVAVKDQPVYYRVTAATGPARPFGNLVAGGDGTTSVIIPGVFFMGPADASGITEIKINI